MPQTYETEEGGFQKEGPFRIGESRYGYVEGYNDRSGDPACCLSWTSSEDEEQRLIFSCGQGWEPVRGGLNVEHPDGKERFRSNSQVGRLFKRVVTELGVDMDAYGHDADAWEGFVFDLRLETTDYGGEIGAKSRLMPAAVLETPKPKSRGKVTPLRSGPAKPTVSKAPAPIAEKPLLAKKLSLQAKKMTRDEFQSWALEQELSPEVEMDVLDDSEDGFWARANVE